LLYPFLPDFQVSLLAALGMSLRVALIVTAVPLALAITGLFYSFARRLASYVENEFSQTTAFSRSNITAALATILFLLNGGLGFIYFYGDWRNSGKSLRDFWSRLDINYANMGGRNMQWTNFIVDTLLPQRGSLFGFAVAVMVFTVFAVVWQGWHSRDATDDKLNGWRLLLAAGVLTGLLPLFHTHIYFGIGLVSGFLFLLRPRRQWLAFWLPALVLASPHLIDILRHVSGNSFMRFQPGWRGHGERVWVWFWLRNIGLPALLIIPAWFAVPATWRKFYLSFVCLLIFSLLVVVTPNDYDNIKLIYLWYAPTCALLAAWLVRLAVVQRQRLLASVLALLCIASGLLALQYEDASHNLLYSYEEMAAAAFALQKTSPQALFLTAPSVHQPILSLAGRLVLRGDTAWLWSHGYQFADREADVKSIYAGSSEALQLIDYYGIDFVYLGPRELQAGANQTFFDTHLQAVYHSDKITIYDAPGSVSKARRPGLVKPRELASRLDHDPYQLLVEFPRTTFSAYQLYKAAFGRRPRFAEFMDDMKTLGRELYVGREGWEQALGNNKNALAQKWVERPDFKAVYEDKSNEQYVDVLLNNIGLGEERRHRDAMIAALNGGSKSRAQVLREVAEMDNSRLEYNDAYVLVHYFGYLRRNPDDAPDNNLVGFNFWLNDLNRTGDYRSVSRVFIESGEYIDRSRRQEQ
jgi:hypothetical protein